MVYDTHFFLQLKKELFSPFESIYGRSFESNEELVSLGSLEAAKLHES